LEERLSTLVERLRPAFGEHLVSVILYGSAAAGDWNEHSSDLNILCVLDQISPHELLQSEPIFRWWREQGHPPPLLLSEEEVRSSSDSFPMEFQDLAEHRRVLHGSDVIDGVTIDKSFYRAQVEHELRAKQIRLRQKAAEVLSNPDRLLLLMTESVSTFCVLGRHALILSNHPAHWKKAEIVADLEDALRRSFAATNEILAIRAAGKRKVAKDTAALFEGYLREVDALVRFVDRLEK